MDECGGNAARNFLDENQNFADIMTAATLEQEEPSFGIKQTDSIYRKGGQRDTSSVDYIVLRSRDTM